MYMMVCIWILYVYDGMYLDIVCMYMMLCIWLFCIYMMLCIWVLYMIVCILVLYMMMRKEKEKVCDEMKWKGGIYSMRKTLYAQAPYVIGLDFPCSSENMKCRFIK